MGKVLSYRTTRDHVIFDDVIMMKSSSVDRSRSRIVDTTTVIRESRIYFVAVSFELHNSYPSCFDYLWRISSRVLLSVSASRELQQTETVTSFSSSSGSVARGRISVSTSSDKPSPKASSSNSRVDVYCLLDVTESKRGTLAKLRAEARIIVEDVFKTSSRVRFGIGEYRDEGDSFSFSNEQSITNDQGDVVDALKGLRFERGTAKKESQLYALDRVAKNGDIGFRTKKSIKIIVWVGDTVGKDPVSGVTEASAIKALKGKDIYVVAIDTGSLDSTKQATRIIKARGGALLKKNAEGLYDVVLLETGPIKASASGDKASVTTESIDGSLSLSEAVVQSVKVIVSAAEK